MTVENGMRQGKIYLISCEIKLITFLCLLLNEEKHNITWNIKPTKINGKKNKKKTKTKQNKKKQKKNKRNKLPL